MSEINTITSLPIKSLPKDRFWSLRCLYNCIMLYSLMLLNMIELKVCDFL